MLKRNLYRWERLLRVLIGLALLAWALLAGSAPVWQYIAGGTGVTLIATALLGFCPLCAMAGRSISPQQ